MKKSLNTIIKNFEFGIGWYKGEPFKLFELQLFAKEDWGMVIISMQIAKFSISFLYSTL